MVLAFPLLVLAFGLLFVERRFIAGRSYAPLALHGHHAPLLPMGRWRTLVSAACWTIIGVTLLPLVGLAARALRGGGFSRAPEWLGGSVWNSLLPAVVAATVLLAIASILGRALALERSGARLLDALAVLTFVMPGVVLGISLLALWNRPSLQAVYGSFLIIALGYTARYAVLPVRVMASAIALTPAHLEEAAAVHGAGFLRRFARVVLPVNARAAAGAWMIAFIFCLRDLETSIVFYPPGGAPLTARIVQLEANGPEAVVAALSLVHVALVVTALVIGATLLRRRGAE
jgi:iron(III) transport system permease protein